MGADSQQVGSGASTMSTLDRALALLEEFVHGPARGRGVSELAQVLALPKGSVHRILSSLSSRGLVLQDPHTQRYHLGAASLRLGVAYMSRADVTRLARPVLEHVSLLTGETATLSVRVGEWQRVYVDQVLPDREVRMTISTAEPYPLHAGGSGRALLAFLPAREQEAYLSRLERGVVPPAEPAEPRALRSLLEDVREAGWTHSAGDHMPGAASVAAAVLGHANAPVAAISVCGPADRFNSLVNSHVVHLLDAVEELSVRLGRGD